MKTRLTAQDHYLSLYVEAQQVIEQIQNKIHELPSPDGETEINWANVGDMGRIVNELKEILI